MLVPHCSQNKDIQVIWAKFMDIIGDLKLDFTSEEGILELQRNSKSWFEHFLKVYQAKDVTPYMHALCYHVPEFLSLYQNIAYYTQQCLEKYNNRASKDFFRSKNHKGVDALCRALPHKITAFFPYSILFGLCLNEKNNTPPNLFREFS